MRAFGNERRCNMKMIDLSIVIENDVQNDPVPSIPKIKYFSRGLDADTELLKSRFGASEDDVAGAARTREYIEISAHAGTHMDSPYHFFPTMHNGAEPSWTIDEVPLEWCFSNGVVFDFSDKDDGYILMPEDFQKACADMDYRIKPLDIVMIISGAAPYKGSAEYLVRGCGAGRAATCWLMEQGVRVVGTDAWSWDPPLPITAKRFVETGDKELIWEGHYAGRFGCYFQMEKLDHLALLPKNGFKLACFPIAVCGASGGFVRPVAFVDGI